MCALTSDKCLPLQSSLSHFCSSGAMPLSRDELEKDFQGILDFCEKEKFAPGVLWDVCKPLAASCRRRFWSRVALVTTVGALVWWLCSSVEVVSWSASAVGRLLLIELLPIWNWTPLYNAKCLVDKDVVKTVATGSAGKYETDAVNCVLCEKLEIIPRLSNVTYSTLEQFYLERGLPVVISDSHANRGLEEMLQAMLTSQDHFLDSNPCDIETNLLLKKFFTIGAALEKIAQSTLDDEWFLQLRNCQFKAVKASRKFILRPYYYPLHFEPFYSSWLLMANQYKGMERELYVQGLVLVQQISGEMRIHLVPKAPCGKLCVDLEVLLQAGEALAFSTDLWTLNYQFVGGFDAIATIMEIDWRY